ncbi:MAG: tyrosine-type recombinase/integrase [Thermoleophilia bacterium]|nr:tyrosine-type recombinase/integrase [Thermoleophilia bacterium]
MDAGHLARIVPIVDPDDVAPRRDPGPARRRPGSGGRIGVGLRPAPGRRARVYQDARGTPDGGRRPRAVRLLREQRLARQPNEGGYLFPSRAGTPYDGNNFMGRIFKPAARAAGIPEPTFHDLRHTGASLMIAAGCHVKVMAEQMGHSDGGGLVLKRYGHLYKGARRQAAVTLEAHIFGRGTGLGWRPVGARS